MAITNNTLAHYASAATKGGKGGKSRRLTAGEEQACMAAGAAEQGPVRRTQEDYFDVLRDARMGWTLAAVYDGHGGSAAAELLSRGTLSRIRDRYSRDGTTWEDAILRTYEWETEYARERHADELHECGTTMCMAAASRTALTLAWLGDSRAVLVRSDGSAEALTRDHKPDGEVDRIRRDGGYVLWRRLNGVLATSRAFGDWSLQGLGREPEVRTVPIGPNDRYVILGSDGLWDSPTPFPEEEAASVMLRALGAHNGDLGRAAQALVAAALERGSEDNVTAVVMRLHH